MKKDTKLWVFGHSVCLPYGLDESCQGWADMLAHALNSQLENLASPGVDNFYIYYQYQQVRDKISHDDFVVIGWSHYSRKLFEVDHTNQEHNKVVEKSLTYDTPHAKFMRNGNPMSGTAKNWLNMRPQPRGVAFYDTWYRDYYSELEQKINFQSYLDAVRLTCAGHYLPFYFSKESVQGVDIDPCHAGFVTEYILENNLSISEQDLHFHQAGHKIWAQHIEKHLTKMDFLK